LRYPASWRTDEAKQEGMWYRYFLGPSQKNGKTAVSVTLLAGPLSGSLDDYAQTYLAGNAPTSGRDEPHLGLAGRAYAFASADGATRFRLLLLRDADKVYGLFAQGESHFVEQNGAILEEMFASLSLERAESYPEMRDEAFGFSLRVPPSWRESRRFSGHGTLLLQLIGPALAADKSGETVHASLTLTVEPMSGDFEEFYRAFREKQGQSFQLLAHVPWKGGYADSLRSETPMAVSRVKRFCRAASGRAYSLSFEGRDDIFYRASRWCDLIASSLKIGPELVASPATSP
jgi:hypothetical protein